MNIIRKKSFLWRNVGKMELLFLLLFLSTPLIKIGFSIGDAIRVQDNEKYLFTHIEMFKSNDEKEINKTILNFKKPNIRTNDLKWNKNDKILTIKFNNDDMSDYYRHFISIENREFIKEIKVNGKAVDNDMAEKRMDMIDNSFNEKVSYREVNEMVEENAIEGGNIMEIKF